MNDGAMTFFDLIVEPALAEYAEAERQLTASVTSKIQDADTDAVRGLVLRRARTATIELHQFCDRVVAYQPNWVLGDTTRNVRRWLTKHHVRRVDGTPALDLELLRDVADAFKHVHITHLREGRDWFITSDGAVVRTASGYGNMAFGEGKFGGVEQTVIELKTGQRRALCSVLTTVRDAWAAAMGRTRILPLR